ncbi:unnamed protein product [Calypogeia fissa]
MAAFNVLLSIEFQILHDLQYCLPYQHRLVGSAVGPPPFDCGWAGWRGARCTVLPEDEQSTPLVQNSNGADSYACAVQPRPVLARLVGTLTVRYAPPRAGWVAGLVGLDRGCLQLGTKFGAAGLAWVGELGRTGRASAGRAERIAKAQVWNCLPCLCLRTVDSKGPLKFYDGNTGTATSRSPLRKEWACWEEKRSAVEKRERGKRSNRSKSTVSGAAPQFGLWSSVHLGGRPLNEEGTAFSTVACSLRTSTPLFGPSEDLRKQITSEGRDFEGYCTARVAPLEYAPPYFWACWVFGFGGVSMKRRNPGTSPNHTRMQVYGRKGT